MELLLFVPIVIILAWLLAHSADVTFGHLDELQDATKHLPVRRKPKYLPKPTEIPLHERYEIGQWMS